METQPECVEPAPGADSTKLRSKHMCTGEPVRTLCVDIKRQTELLMHTLWLWAQPSSVATAFIPFLFFHWTESTFPCQ